MYKVFETKTVQHQTGKVIARRFKGDPAPSKAQCGRETPAAYVKQPLSYA